jgi:cytochrome c553
VIVPCARAAAAIAAALVFSPAYAADIEAGRQKAQVCAACHGPDGVSANPLVPSLAGQPAQFIATQLYMFREGNRKDVQMSPMAAALSNADLNDLAAYFNAQKPAQPAHAAAPEKIAIAQRVTQQYHCVSCHGPALLGQQHIPRLAGQQADYLRAQLRGFKAGTRYDMDGNMTSILQTVPAEDIDVLVEYLSGLGGS